MRVTIYTIIHYCFNIASCRTTSKALVYNYSRRRRRQPARKRKQFFPVIWSHTLARTINDYIIICERRRTCAPGQRVNNNNYGLSACPIISHDKLPSLRAKRNIIIQTHLTVSAPTPTALLRWRNNLKIILLCVYRYRYLRLCSKR